MASSKNPLQYTDYDWDNLVTNLENRLKETDAWKDTGASRTGNMVIEFQAYIGEMLLYLLERRAEEGYLATAQNKSSVLNLVKLIRYEPKRKVSAVGSLQITLTQACDKIVFIPKYTTCQTTNGIKYMVSLDAAIVPPNTLVIAEGIQGELVELTFSSDGTANQSYAISDTDVENTNYEVIVDGEVWTEVSTFLSSTSTSKHYRIEPEIDDTLTLYFGDNVRGMAPTAGKTIIFRYVQSDGLTGNVYQTGLITTLNDSIYDEDGTVVDATVTNTTTFTSGDDAEDIEEIKDEAPAVFQTGDRAVTRTDFKTILKNYPSVADANAWGENEESPPNYTMFNTAKLCVILEDWQHPTDSLKTLLGEYLYLESMITIKYEFIQATIIEVVPTLDVLVNPNYSLSQVQSDIEEVLADSFTLGVTTKLGTSMNYSNIVADIDYLGGVNHHHLILKVHKNLVANFESAYDYGEELDATPIKEESVFIHASVNGIGTVLAYDDGAGNLVDAVSGYAVSGYINYATGAIGVNLDTEVGISGVYVLYEQDSAGDVDVIQNQICKLHDVNITAISYVS